MNLETRIFSPIFVEFLQESQNEFSQDSSSSLENIQCDRCDKRFKTFGGLKIHYAAHLRDDNKVTCRGIIFFHQLIGMRSMYVTMAEG